MYVPSHTQQAGNSSLLGSYTNTKVGTSPQGLPLDDQETFTYLKSFSSKSAPTPKVLAAPGFLAPKSYYRHVARVVDMQPERIHYFSLNKEENKADYVASQMPCDYALETPEYDAGQVPNDLRSAAIVCALNRLRQGNRLQLGADIGEGRKTLAMVGEATSRVLNAYRSVKRGNVGLAARHLLLNGHKPSSRTAAGRWLELQYGWLPLTGTIYDGISAVREGFRDPSSHIYSSKCVQKHSATRDFTDPGRDAKGEYEWISKVQLYYRVKNDVVDQLDKFGLLNPLSIAWELVPFSFVLDWFVPVGNSLSALTATAGLEFVAGYHTSLAKGTFTKRVIRTPGPGYTQIDPGLYKSESFQMHRGPFTEFPSSELYVSTHPFSTKRVVNALALLRQLL